MKNGVRMVPCLELVYKMPKSQTHFSVWYGAQRNIRQTQKKVGAQSFYCHDQDDA